MKRKINAAPGRRSRKANSESLDEAGDATHVHIKLITPAKRRTAYDPQTGAKKTAGQLSADFSWLLSKKAQFAP
jgi:hypothetical protein